MTNIQKILIVLILIPSFSFAQKNIPAKTAKKNRSISSEALVIPCEEQVLNTLGTLEPPIEWVELSFGPIKTEGVRVFKSLTPTADAQLGLAISKDKALVQRRDRLSLNEYTFDAAKKCVGTISTTQFKKIQPPIKAQFTDFDLKKIVDASRTDKRIHLLYLWSPSMNLSVTGVNEIRKLAQKKHYDLAVIADPMVSQQALRDIALHTEWPPQYVKQLDSDVLKSINFMVHFPALIVVKDGKISAVRPGYDEPRRLEKYISGFGK